MCLSIELHQWSIFCSLSQTDKPDIWQKSVTLTLPVRYHISAWSMLRRDDRSLSNPGQMAHLIHAANNIMQWFVSILKQPRTNGTFDTANSIVQWFVFILKPCVNIQLKSNYLFKNLKCTSCAYFLACMLLYRITKETIFILHHQC